MEETINQIYTPGLLLLAGEIQPVQFFNLARLIYHQLLLVEVVLDFDLLGLHLEGHLGFGLGCLDELVLLGDFVQFFAGFLLIELALLDIAGQTFVGLLHLVDVTFIAIDFGGDAHGVELRQLPHECFVKVLHHILKFGEERAFSDEMLHVLEDLKDELVDLVVDVQTDWVGNVFLVVEHEELFFSLEAYPLQILLQTFRFVHRL